VKQYYKSSVRTYNYKCNVWGEKREQMLVQEKNVLQETRTESESNSGH